MWNNLPLLFEDVDIFDYVIMPNHFHGVISLGKHPCWKEKGSAANLGNVIKAFKSKSTNLIKKNGLFTEKLLWQKSYHDRIIQNETEFYQLRKYIHENSAKWGLDSLNKINNM